MNQTVVTFAPALGPLDNPLKGWAPYTDGTIYQPYTMVYCYVSWRDLEPRKNEYAFDAWEAKMWNVSKAQGKHVIFRVYVDYPTLPSGLPDYLRAQGVTETVYSAMGGGISPNYEHPALIDGMERLITALGARYDQNDRVAFVEAGLLGHWGEWHTYPNPALFASPTTQRRVVDAYRKAFTNKKILFRYAGGYVGQQPWVGFHDDYFPEDTGTKEDWNFLAQIRRAGRRDNWRRAAIGGEMIPEKGKNALKWMGSAVDFDFTLARATDAHFTWIGPYCPGLEIPPNREFDVRCQTLVRRMGYQFRLLTLRHDAVLREGKPLSIELRGVNEGIAPFYYPWQVNFALIDVRGRVATRLPLPRVDIRDWQPGDAFTLTETIKVPYLPIGIYTLAFGILAPGTGRPAISFANRLPPRTAEGWTSLSTLVVENRV